ncbi:MAG TPA: hypothetical protein DCM05_06895 [Elusimicrobia bacterium]|nr:MAG: hypothetical protein A3J79_00090 [Elusimicrobia bacterium RIFOXYB2_FULL_62_6]HAH06242.1 hypothetical protein [Elusimicrobiota bacterium]
MRRPTTLSPRSEGLLLAAVDLVGALTLKSRAEVAASPALRQAVAKALEDPAVLKSLCRMARRLAKELQR